MIVGKDRRIIGFDPSPMPTPDTLQTVLEGRITTVPPEPNAASFKAFVESQKVLLDGEPPRAPGPDDHKPNIAPSYQVHISSSDGGEGKNFSGEDFRNLLNMDLKSVVAQIYHTNPARIVLPAALDDHKHYNFVILLPKAETHEELDNRLLHGIEDYFHLTAMREQRMMNVYVATVLDGKPPKTKIQRSDDPSAALDLASSVEFRMVSGADVADDFAPMPMTATLADISGIAVDGTLDQFCRTLEQAFDKPLVNETNLAGEFSFRVDANKEGDKDFVARLRDEFNLVIAPGQRSVAIVALKAR